MPESLQEYQAFIQEVDARCARLVKGYGPYLSCRKGCSECCTDISVLPVEAFSLILGLRSVSGLKSSNQVQENRCSFLDTEGACSVYPLRPLICRTHGLPLLYQILEYGPDGTLLKPEEGPEWQLFYCDLNFREVPEDQWEEVFRIENVLDMEEWNRTLIEVNERFRGSADGSAFLSDVWKGKYGQGARKELYNTGRIPLSSLAWSL
jgi:hypothetical protein